MRRTFLGVNYFDITKKYLYPKLNGYGGMTREKYGLLAVPRTVPV